MPLDRTDLTKRKITNLGGKAAVFVRGFMGFVDTYAQDDDGGVPMRKAQEAGMAAVQELGEEISIPYISKLTGLLIASGVLERAKVGRKYMVFASDLYPWLTNHLESTSWGNAMQAEMPMDHVAARSAFLDHMKEHGAVRIKSNEPLEKAAYMLAIEKFKAGEYDMVFVERNEAIGILPEGWDADDVIPTHDPTASVANQ